MRYQTRGWEAHGLLIALSVGYVCLPIGDVAQKLLYDVIAVGAMIVAFLGLRENRPAHPRGWLLVLLGFSGWLLGDLVWLVESLTSPRFPAPSDVFYLASYLVVGAGVLAIVRTRRSGGDRAAFLDAAILTTGAGVLVAVFLIGPLSSDTSLGPLAKVVSTAYPLGDIFLLAALTRILTSPGARNSSYRLLLGAMLVTTLTDSVWNILISTSGNVVTDRRWLNAGWLCAYLLLAAAARSRSMVLVAEPAPPADVAPFGRRRIVAMGTGLLLPAVVLVADGLYDESVNWPVIALGAAVMSALVLVRFVDLLSTVRSQAVQLAALARIDPLTGAPNRRTWDHELSQACRFARDHGSRLSVAILDLDHFKVFNDTHGHQAGDQLLRDAVEVWSRKLPETAMLARYGGEEFAVLMPGRTLAEAHEVMAALMSCTPLNQSFSAGIAEWKHGDDPENPMALVAAADEALYRAKRGGRSRILAARAGSAGRIPRACIPGYAGRADSRRQSLRSARDLQRALLLRLLRLLGFGLRGHRVAIAVRLHDRLRDPATTGHGLTVGHRPFPDRCGLVAIVGRLRGARRGPAAPRARAAAGGGDELGEGIAELGGVGGRQVDFELAAVQTEGHRLGRFRAVNVVDQHDVDLLGHRATSIHRVSRTFRTRL